MTAISEAQLIEAAQRLRRLEESIEDADILLAVRQEYFRQRIANGQNGESCDEIEHIQNTRDALAAAVDLVKDDMNAAHELIRRLQS